MDYRVKITIRNNRLLKAMEAKGYASVAQFTKENGLQYQPTVELISGKKKPLKFNAELTRLAKEVLDRLDIDVEDAFTERQLKGFKRNSFETEMTEAQALQIANPLKNQESLSMEKDLKDKINSLIDQRLSPRKARMVRLYFFEGMNTEEIGKVFNITRSCVDQFIKKSLYRLSNCRKELLEAGLADVFPNVGEEPILIKTETGGIAYK